MSHGVLRNQQRLRTASHTKGGKRGRVYGRTGLTRFQQPPTLATYHKRGKIAEWIARGEREGWLTHKLAAHFDEKNRAFLWGVPYLIGRLKWEEKAGAQRARKLKANAIRAAMARAQGG